MAITILIVDDDKLLVDKLEETVNWSKIGIDMVFYGKQYPPGAKTAGRISNRNAFV